MTKKKIYNPIMTLSNLFIEAGLVNQYINFNILVISYFCWITWWLDCKFMVYINYFIFFLIESTNNFILPGLQNIISTIHPRLMLWLYSTVLSVFVTTSFNQNVYTLRIITYVLINLQLGGYWAFQEFTWGGWWNWDLVETPPFIIILILIYMLYHFNTSSFDKSNISHSLLKLFITHFVIVRFSTNSVHSFVLIKEFYSLYFTIIVFKYWFIIYIGLGLFLPTQLFILKKPTWVISVIIMFISKKLTLGHNVVLGHLTYLIILNINYRPIINSLQSVIDCLDKIYENLF